MHDFARVKRYCCIAAPILIGALSPISAVASGGATKVWCAYPESGRIVSRPFSAGRPGEPVAIVEAGAGSLPGTLAVGPDGLPGAAWLAEGGDILFSGWDGRSWSRPETVVRSMGNHRGVPSLALLADGGAVVAWAEADEGSFEDVFYAVRLDEGWSEARRAHEPNDSPDIMPRALASVDGRFCIRWSAFDGARYVERRIGDDIPPLVPEELPDAVVEAARERALPPRAALAWRDPGGVSRSVYLAEIMDGLTADKRGTPGVRRASGAIRIVCLGDSITYGRGSSSNGPRTGYPVWLQAILTYDYPGQVFEVINEGNPGERTSGGLSRIDEVLDEHSPDYILIMEGTNDIYFGISFETIQENLKQMAFRAAARGVVPVLATVIPTNPASRSEQYARTKSFYRGGYVQALWDYYGIPYSDQWNAFVTMPDLGELIDPVPGNHPNDDGYMFVMAPRWDETLAALLVNLPFTPTEVNVGLSESAPTVTRGSSETFSYSLVPSNDLVRNAVDCYAAVRAPDGRFYYFGPGWTLTASPAALARRVLLQSLPPSGLLLELPIPESAPPGLYTFYILTVRSLHALGDSGAWTSNLATIDFQVW